MSNCTHDGGSNPSESLDALDLTRELNEIQQQEQYLTEEHTFVDLIGTRFVTLGSGTIPGTLELSGQEDVPQPTSDWRILFMGNPRRYYALRFFGDERLCMEDLMILRLKV